MALAHEKALAERRHFLAENLARVLQKLIEKRFSQLRMARVSLSRHVMRQM
jgi:hypothetical protein